MPSMESDGGSPPKTTTTIEDDTSPTKSRSSFLRRFSRASLSSVTTLLPQYSVADPTNDPASPASDVSPGPRRDGHLSWNSPVSSSVIRPPRYSLPNVPLTGGDNINTPIDSESEFRHSYPIRPKRPWATLHLHTRDAVPGNIQPLQTQPRVPRFWSCDPIKGTLELDLDSPQNIQQIDILLSGNIIISSHSDGCLQFLGHEFTVWDKSMGDPLPGQSDANRKQKKDFDGRFAPGQYSFPFSFPFPTHADPITKSAIFNANSTSPFPPPASGEPQSPSHKDGPEKKRRSSWTSRLMSSGSSPSGSHETASASSKVQPSSPSISPPASHSLTSSLPKSFMEKDVNSNVAYEISVCINHGRFRASSKIKTKIAYFPASHPLPASQKRQEAYEAGAFLPSPMDDPEGWLAWPSLTVCGVVNSGDKPRHTKVQCTVYVAQPLSYTRGSVIPCFLTISSDDEEVVDLLSNRKAPILRLLRRIRHPLGNMDKSMAERNPQLGVFISTGLSYQISSIPTGEMKLVAHEVGRAQWWIPSKDVIQSPNTRHLEGEIHLSQSLPPSCDFQFFGVEYAVELLPFQTDNFEPDEHPLSLGKLRRRDTGLVSKVVEITTLYREDEPVPTSYCEPPKTHTIREVNSHDKNASILEEDE